MNEITNDKFKRFTQTVSYLPHFLSWVIYGGLIIKILSVETGAVNNYLLKWGIIDEPIFFLGEPKYFWSIAVISALLKELGWSAILYLAAIAGVDQELYEAAIIDGAGRFKRMWHITLPSISGTIVILLIFAISGILSSGFDQIWMLQNPLNVDASEVIDTYVYKVGLQQMRFSYSTAVGLMRSVVAVILLLGANFVSNKITEKEYSRRGFIMVRIKSREDIIFDIFNTILMLILIFLTLYPVWFCIVGSFNEGLDYMRGGVNFGQGSLPFPITGLY